MSDDRCEGMERFLRRLAPGTPVALWFDSSGFVTTVFEFVKDDLAAFSGGALGSGTTYVDVCAIQALKLGVPMADAGGPNPQAEGPQEPGDGTADPSDPSGSASAPSDRV